MSISTGTPKGTLYVVSTSHMDWDWVAQFEQYYACPINSPDTAVRNILDTAIHLCKTYTGSPATHTSAATPAYRYNLAELAWMKRYMLDNPDTPAVLNQLDGRFLFIGGGITSPDNLICNGEAFIRNYLVGRSFLTKMGLSGLLDNSCWIPDDFGSDPQLPVVVKAMGMNGISFARIPGENPGPSVPIGKPGSQSVPDSHNLTLLKEGVTFNWEASDGSKVLSFYMYPNPSNPDYGVVWAQQSQDGADSAALLGTFVSDTVSDSSNPIEQKTKPDANIVNQPGNLLMAPCGGDFSYPSTYLPEAVACFNTPGSGIATNNYTAVMGSFQDFIQAMNQQIANNTVQLIDRKNFDLSVYFTGYFASRVQLKINHQRTVNQLVSAEMLSTLLRSQSSIAFSTLDLLNNGIDAAWDSLLPSTHHDFITGTSSDNTYYAEQLPLSQLALTQATSALDQGMNYLSSSAKAAPANGEIPYVVFNPSGCQRTNVGTVIELPPHPQLGSNVNYRFAGESNVNAAQVLKNGNIVLPCPSINSTGYTCVYLSPSPVVASVAPPANPFVLNNGLIQITIDQENGWALSGILDVANNTELVHTGEACNVLVNYRDIGNLYQMGNELTSHAAEGFSPATDAPFTTDGFELHEAGPFRWHFAGKLTNTLNNEPVLIEYILEYGEPLVRIRITGSAQSSSNDTTVVTSWKLQDTTGAAPKHMSYGTANHWNGPELMPYWHGPTFRPTHDFLALMSDDNTQSAPVAALYHEGMNAWAHTNGELLGILFRNADGMSRGAAGTDLETHTQNFAFRLPGVQGLYESQMLCESTAFQQPQLTRFVNMKTSAVIRTMAEQDYLVNIEEDNALIRAVRTLAGSGTALANPAPAAQYLPFSFALRIYQPSNQPLNATLQFSSNATIKQVTEVNALEESLAGATAQTVTDNTYALNAIGTLTTWRFLASGHGLINSNGK